MINWIFRKTVEGFVKLSQTFGITYEEMNIVVYYILIPYSWAVLLDLLIEWPIFMFLAIFIDYYVFVYKDFRKSCFSLWQASVDFLLQFKNYKVASVIFCIFVPIIVYIELIVLLLI